jgi:hypothetical protein
VDVFVLSETLEHVERPAELLAAIRKKARHLLLSTPLAEFDDRNPEHYWGWDKAGIRELLDVAGWRADHFETLHAAIRQLVHLSDMDGFLMEWQLFPEGTIPEYTTPEWYAGRERAPHLEQEPHKWRLETAAGYVAETVALTCGAAVVDLGAGDGGLLSLVRDRVTDWGGRRASAMGTTFRSPMWPVRWSVSVPVGLLDVVSDFDRIEWPVGPVTAVCTEMLEHLVDPYGFLAKVAGTPTIWWRARPSRRRTGITTNSTPGPGTSRGTKRSWSGPASTSSKHERWGMFQVLLAERAA